MNDASVITETALKARRSLSWYAPHVVLFLPKV